MAHFDIFKTVPRMPPEVFPRATNLYLRPKYAEAFYYDTHLHLRVDLDLQEMSFLNQTWNLGR